MAFYFQLNSWKQGTSERGPVNWPIYQFLDGWWTTPCRARKCIPRGYTAKGNCFLGRTKLSLGQLFPFLDHQLCLASLRSADNLLMITESEKLSHRKFCSSSKTFLFIIPCRNIYSCPWEKVEKIPVFPKAAADSVRNWSNCSKLSFLTSVRCLQSPLVKVITKLSKDEMCQFQ